MPEHLDARLSLTAKRRAARVMRAYPPIGDPALRDRILELLEEIAPC